MSSPQFALTLSLDGISLLRRAEDGWRTVGEVSLDADDLVDDLASLRRRAAEIDEDTACKLVIPNAQILYTSCPATGSDDLADEVRVRSVLVGATPYDVSDLVFDWESDGETLQIAVVAKETLREARDFADEHGFEPVGYVAMPPRGVFLREPFFGPVDRTPDAGPAMIAEAEPISIVGAWADAPTPSDARPAPDAADAAAEPALGDAPSIETVDTASPANDPELAEPAALPIAAAHANESAAVGGDDVVDPQEAAAPSKVAGAASATDGPEEEALPSFSSIRGDAGEVTTTPLRADRTPATAPPVRKLGGALRGETPASPPTMETTPDDGAESQPAIPVFTSRKAVGAKSETVEKLAQRSADRSGNESESPEIEIIPPATGNRPESPQPAHCKPRLAAFREKVVSLRRQEPPALTPEIIAAPLPRPSEADLAAAMSAPRASNDLNGGRTVKRRVPLGLTGALVLALAVLGLWSEFFLGEEKSSTSASLTPQSLASAAPTRGADGALTRSITFAESGTSAATLDGSGESELAEVLEAPAAPAAEDEAIALASVADDPFSAMPEEPAQISEPMLEIAPLPEIDADPELGDAEPDAGDNPIPPSRTDVAAAYAETGIWQRAPEVRVGPETDSTDDIYIASIDPAVAPLDAVALPRAESAGGSDTAVPVQPAPVPPGQVVTFDENGMVRPSPDGVVTGDGFTLFAGRPPLVPRPRSGTPAETAALSTDVAEDPVKDSLAGLRPKGRPDSLAEDNEKATLGGRTRAELAALRPRLRPQSAQDAADAERQAAIEDAVRTTEAEAADARALAEAEIRNASALAVAASRTPSSRPDDFASRVAATRKAAARRAEQAREREENDAEEPTRTAAARTVVMPRNQKVAPSLPTSASVAKAATSRNALKLREVNLIGVFGSPSQRRALVRLPSGRLVKVKVGDRVDGGQVAAIGENELRYVKRGRNIVLAMPRS